MDDGDGIPDSEEALDSDGDGISDELDGDDDGDGIADDIDDDDDNDGIPDHLDLSGTENQEIINLSDTCTPAFFAHLLMLEDFEF